MGPKMAIFGPFPYMLDRGVVHTFPCTNLFTSQYVVIPSKVTRKDYTVITKR